MWYCFCLSGRPAPLPLFCRKYKIPNHLCGGRPDHHDKRVYGLSGCHREGLVFLVRPEFLLDVGSSVRGGQTQAKYYLGIGLHQGARIFFFFGVRAVHVVQCSLYSRMLNETLLSHSSQLT